MRHVLIAVTVLLSCCSAATTTASAAAPSAVAGLESQLLIGGEHAGDRIWQLADAGDVNGDERDDLIVSYSNFHGAGDPSSSARAYVVFGDGTDAPVDLAALGNRGFAIEGTEMAPWSLDVQPGGDVNGDGLQDVLLSESFADDSAGRVSVVFGADSSATVDVESLGLRGYTVTGSGSQSYAGSASSVADLDGDGNDELLVVERDRATLLYGTDDTAPVSLGSLAAGAGYRINGIGNPQIGSGSAVGDVDGDGLEDFALTSDCQVSTTCVPRSWVVFGRSGTADIALSALGDGGYTITGHMLAGVGPAGDVNGDDKADVLLNDVNSDRSFVLFGRSATSPLSLDVLGSAGFRINAAPGRYAPYVTAIGDLDGDGLDDLLARDADPADVILFGKADSAPLDVANPLDRGFTIGTGAAYATLTGSFAGTPRLAVAFPQDGPFGRSNAGSIRLLTPPAPTFELPPARAYARGGEIAPVAPTAERRASPLSWSVRPALPAGLALDPASGTISGTPTQPTAAQSYAVTARDRLGSVTRTVELRIDDDAYATVAPAAGATVGARPLFAWQRASAADDSEPVAGYTVIVDDAPLFTHEHGACAAQCERTAPRPLADGQHSWHVETTARDGHVRRTPSARFTVADPPQAHLSLSRSAIHTGEPVGLDASASSDANGGVVRYQFDLDGDGSFETDGGRSGHSSASFSTIGARTLGVRVTDAGGLTAVATATVRVTPAPPAGELGISINDGAIATSNPNVTISLVWPRLAETALLSNDGGFGAAGSTTSLGLVARVPWTLASSGPERLPKIVYLRFRGGESGRETYTDDIILDQRPPQVVAASIAPVAATAAAAASGPKQKTKPKAKGKRKPKKAKQPTLTVTGRDDNSGLRQLQLARRRGGKPFLTKQLVRGNSKGRRSQRVTLRVPAGGKLFARVTDVAGNSSGWKAVKRAR
ncbi:putative Ig domain-containing protein [Conexibacter stalactiti]|uniref:Ig domain-containing protein n=1 Tax=Conexibacter stalactiti TaxID=1940611 RepID=A0ABU4HZ13_9ACTN|nr:putative Ig domain-containing protein [Conexibacter stalactiti]MDW5598561.1 putative Ig domain-containing protein [Conexibacter stalactiti]MEC5039203.1 putative Ig domain-containing protein [Conexibacter stalactiti]